MHESALQQLGLPPEAAVNGSAPNDARGGPKATDTAKTTGEPSMGAEVLNHALSEASGWIVSRRMRAPKPPMTRASMQAWLLRGAFGLFAAVVLGAFVFIAIGLMSVTEASALLMPVAILAAMSMGIFLGGDGAETGGPGTGGTPAA